MPEAVIIRIRGQRSGLDFEFEETHGESPSIDDFREMVDYYSVGLGLGQVAVTPAPIVAAGTTPPPPAQQQPPFGTGWQCPTHGGENVQFSQRFGKFECKVRSQQPEPWANDKPWTDRNGVTWWFCRSRS